MTTLPQTLLLLYGPPAVGKMTVAQAISARTGYRVFHNHMTIELVLPFFEFGSPPFTRLVTHTRERIFEEVARSDLPGMIFTLMWDFGDPNDAHFVERCAAVFRDRGWAIRFVELQADQATRLARNATENRLTHKPSKRDVSWSNDNLIACDERHNSALPRSLRGARRLPVPQQHAYGRR